MAQLGWILAGTVMLMVFAWSWVGRGPGARWWATEQSAAVGGSQQASSRGLAMGVLPGLGAFFLALGLFGLGGAWEWPALVLGLVGLPWCIVFYLVPRVVSPPWFRAAHPRRRRSGRR